MENREEKNLLLDRSYTCPVCETMFKSKSVKTGAAKLIDTAIDLRPIYHNVDVTKYDVVLCPQCGYAALTKYFQNLSQAQIMFLKNKVAANFKKRTMVYDYYDYDVTLERFKLALLSAMVKNAEPSELGFISLKISWLLQNRKDALEASEKDYDTLANDYEREASAYSKKALEYFMQARMEEEYPICGMDMPTLDYLLAALCTMDNQLDKAMRMLSLVSSNREASDRLKNKAYDLKTIISEKQKLVSM